MKVAVALLALVSLAYAAPQSRKLFHEHYEDFLDLIMEESRDELGHLLEHYLEFEEFQEGLNYMTSKDFKDLVYEFEELPEFKAVVEFLEGHNIDILFFIDAINQAIDSVGLKRTRHELSGRDISAFIEDSIKVFPQDKLVALYDQKVEEDEGFRNAMADLETDEWHELLHNLFENETFGKEVQALREHGIDIRSLLHEITAVFGKF